MRRVLESIFLIAFLTMHTVLASDNRKVERKNNPARSLARPEATLIDVNNLTSWIQSDALFPPNVNNSFNGSFPRGVNAGFVFQEGILFGGLVEDGSSPIVRVGGTIYPTGMQPGRILLGADGKVIGTENANDTSVNRVWRVRLDYKTADLTDDAAAFFQENRSAVTQVQIDNLRAIYQKDWNEWPAEKGAPYVDVNGDGIYEPDTDIPGVDGASQTLWMVANDLNTGLMSALYGSPPIGIEEQITEWAWHDGSYPEMDNIIYKQVKLIYKGTETTVATSRIDSMYIAQ